MQQPGLQHPGDNSDWNKQRSLNQQVCTPGTTVKSEQEMQTHSKAGDIFKRLGKWLIMPPFRVLLWARTASRKWTEQIWPQIERHRTHGSLAAPVEVVLPHSSERRLLSAVTEVSELPACVFIGPSENRFPVSYGAAPSPFYKPQPAICCSPRSRVALAWNHQLGLATSLLIGSVSVFSDGC